MKDILKRVKIDTSDESFFGRYVNLITDVVVPYQEKVLNDQIEGVEKSHAIENFKLAGKLIKGEKIDKDFYGMVFQDSDVAKWLEAAAYSLYNKEDKELESRCDEVISIIADAQHEDGYLNTYFTLKDMDKRWTNLREAHELYCAGHMIEAAVAYANVTGKRQLVDIMCKMVDHIYERFITKGLGGVGGHPEIKLALMRLYELTGNEKHKELAIYFVNERGVDSDFYIKEREKNPWDVWGNNPQDKEYLQNHLPVREQTKAVGHAVRAVYLYSGMADVAKETNDESLKKACETLWNNITQARMYITGAIGSAYEGEAFTKDYHLPNDSAYAETCASISLVFFARRMLELEKDGKYADIMERALYNGTLAGMELDGTKFFYVNPLEVIPGISGEASSHPHTKPVRPGWFACACCPPNVARLIGSLGNYTWYNEDNIIYSNLFIGSTLDLDGGKVILSTKYPYDNLIKYKFETDSEIKDTFAIRIPNWSTKTKVYKNGKEVDLNVEKGYLYIDGPFINEDEISVELDMSVKKVYTNPKVNANSGKIAFLRGPLVYCAEGADNEDIGQVLAIRIKKDGKINLKETKELGGVTQIEIDAYIENTSDELYSFDQPQYKNVKATLTPYYTWANRGLNQMRVWLPEVN